jgi:hypothetical protein
VDEDHLTLLQGKVRELAGEFGYPNLIAPRAPQYTQFDRALTATIVEAMSIVPADAAHEGVWSFLSLVLLPDVAFWRFPNPAGRTDYERIIGRPRNVFRRLWWRSFALGPRASAGLLEDEAVGIMERASLGGSPTVARTIAEAHLRAVAADTDISRTELMRQATKRLRRISVVVTLSALDDSALRELVEQVIAASMESLRAGLSA